MMKNGAWHLYAGNAPSALVTDAQQAKVVKTARSLARQNGGRVILHKPESALTSGTEAPHDSATPLNSR
ncbi:MAG: hypothetical protein IT531_18990 [Burkholderiales bacterium]|nr:hypothetical protein [Burkholderiales bacterium]